MPPPGIGCLYLTYWFNSELSLVDPVFGCDLTEIDNNPAAASLLPCHAHLPLWMPRTESFLYPQSDKVPTSFAHLQLRATDKCIYHIYSQYLLT